MIKKYSKMFAIALAALCLYVVPVAAMNVTLDEIGTATSKLTSELYGEDPINYFYIIGEYVYTNRHAIDFNDVAAGTRTIPTSIADKDITIYYIEKDGDSWKVSDKIGGNLDLPKSFAITKVDNSRLYSTKVNTSEAVGHIVSAVEDAVVNEESSLHDALDIKNNNGVVTVEILNRTLALNNPDNIKNTGLATVLSEIFANKSYAGIRLTEVLPEDSEGTPKTVEILNEDETTTTVIKNKVLGFLKSLGATSTLDDLAGKKFDLEFLFADEDVLDADDAKSSYRFEFVSKVDTNEYFNITSGGVNYKTSCVLKEEGKQCTPVFNIVNPGKTATTVKDFNAIIKKALNDKLINNVELTIGNVSATYTSSDLETIDDKVGKLISSTNISTFNDFNNNAITIKFAIATDKGAVSKYGNDIEIYKYKIGSYVDFDGIIKSLIDSAKSNKYYDLTMNGNVLTLNVKLDNNTVRTANIINGLATPLTAAKDVTIKIGNETFTADQTSDSNTSIRMAFWAALGVSMYDNVTPGVIANAKNIPIVLTSSNKEAYPETIGDLSEDRKTATYEIQFTVSGFDVDKAATNYATNGGDYFNLAYNTSKDAEGNITSRDLTVQLSHLTTKFSEVIGKGTTGLLANLTKLAGTFTVTVNGQNIDLTDTKVMATQLQEILGITSNDTISSLAGKSATIVITLCDNVNKNVAEDETRVSEYTINVSFKTDNVIKEYDGKTAKLSQLITDGVEKIVLTDNVSTNEEITIDRDFEIVGDGKNIDFNGGLTLSGNIELKLSNVELDGKITIEGSVSDVTITGDKNTVIKGGIDASDDAKVGKLTINSVKIEGAREDLTDTYLIDATGAEEFTMNGSNVRYSGDDSTGDGTVVYSLIKVDGNTSISNSTFDISKIKNPIEFKYYGKTASRRTINKVDIIGNTFTGDNYVANDSHNVISVYALSDGAEVNIKNNTFEYANSMLRISNPDDHSVTYNVVGNTVEKYNAQDEEKSLIMIRPNIAIDLSKITINYKENYFGKGESKSEYTFDASKITESSDTRLVWINDKENKLSNNFDGLKNVNKLDAE